MKNLASKAELARIAGVSKAAVTKLVRGRLKDALDGEKIDLGHPEAQKYLLSKGVDPTAIGQIEPEYPEPHDLEGFEDDGSSEAIGALGKLTLDEIGERFGGLKAFDVWQKRAKTKEEIREKRLKNEETEGSVISRDFVRTHIFGLLEALSRRLLSDASRTIARRLYSAAKAGVPIEEAEQTVRSILEQNLERSHDLAQRRLRE